MIPSRGVNRTSLIDPEKVFRCKTSTLHIKSTKLTTCQTSNAFIEKLSKSQKEKTKNPFKAPYLKPAYFLSFHMIQQLSLEKLKRFKERIGSKIIIIKIKKKKKKLMQSPKLDI